MEDVLRPAEQEEQWKLVSESSGDLELRLVGLFLACETGSNVWFIEWLRLAIPILMVIDGEL